MAKPHAFLHLGPGPLVLTSGDVEVLRAAGVRVPGVSSEQLERARLELLRQHRQAGLPRKDVEGAWARTCRAVFRLRSHVLLSLPGLAEADVEQASLALDSLAGLRVQLVCAGQVPSGWVGLVRPERTHVAGADEAAAAVATLTLEAEQRRRDTKLHRLRAGRRELARRIAA